MHTFYRSLRNQTEQHFVFVFLFENHKVVSTSAIPLSNSSSRRKTSNNMHELVSKDKNTHEEKKTHVPSFYLN